MTSRVETLNRGEAVRVRGERWRVMHVTAHETCSIVELAGVERSNAGRAARFILPFESIDRLSSTGERPIVVRPTRWRRVARATLADASPTWRSLRAAATARIVLLPYQLEPAIAMVSGLSCRMLLADEVGLGKTVQAGLMVAELLAREPDARVLIATPAGLREQWRDELRDRFGLQAAVIDAAALVRAAADLPHDVNPWATQQVVIASIDFLKRPDVIRSLEPLIWDLVAFDEAHALSGPSDRATAAELLATRARRVVAITATPHSGDAAAYERLRAIGSLAPEDDLLMFRRSRTEAGLPRRRVVRRLWISPTDAEARMHHALQAYSARVRREAPVESSAPARLAMIVLARRASSSAASLARSVQRRMTLLDEPPGRPEYQLRLPLDEGQTDEDEEPLAELGAPGLRDAAAERQWLERILGLARAVIVESKVRALGRLLRRTSEPLLVFTEYRDTLHHLSAALGVEAELLHGRLTASERARAVRRFVNGEVRRLLATDAASEGLNLHQRCRLVINLDVPWTPLRLEQRVGRVDRIGQHRRVHAITFVARGTYEAQVAHALDGRSARVERETPFERNADGDTNLRAFAIAEVERLTATRRLLERTEPANVSTGAPAITLLTNRSQGPRLVLAVRLQFLDADGAIMWHTIAGLALEAEPPDDRCQAGVRSWFAAAIDRHRVELVSAATATHAAALESLRIEVRAALHPLFVRERAIVERMNNQSGRLAAPLLQPGLFDRRGAREAAARQRLVEEAAAAALLHIHRLEQQCSPSTGERALAFAVAWAR